MQNERHSSPYNLFSMSTLVLTARIDSNGILDLKDLSPMVIMMVIYFYALEVVRLISVSRKTLWVIVYSNFARNSSGDAIEMQDGIAMIGRMDNSNSLDLA